MSGVVYVLHDARDPDVESDFAFLRKSPLNQSGWSWCHWSRATRFTRAADAVAACLRAEQAIERLDPFRLGYRIEVRTLPVDEVEP